MYKYKIFNDQYEPVPAQPFDTIEEAKRHILSLLEVYNGPFHVVEWKIVFTKGK